MTKNKLKNILIFENWIIMLFVTLLDNFVKIANSFSFLRAVFLVVFLQGGYLLLKKRFLAYKNDDRSEWPLLVIIIFSVCVNYFAIDEIISVLFSTIVLKK